MEPIARVFSPFSEKFGIPRQSGLADSVVSRVVFEPAYRVPEALRGLEGFSHIWLIWQFSGALREGWSPTVKPPRLGGNRRMGVFATRSPFRPNPLGLSCVRLERVVPEGPDGPELIIRGADLLDQTPVYDIKPYLAYTDSHPEATGGFTGVVDFPRLKVDFPPALWETLPPESREAAVEVISQDPRTAYRRDEPDRRWGVMFAGYDIRFVVSEGTAHVVEVVRPGEPPQP